MYLTSEQAAKGDELTFPRIRLEIRPRAATGSVRHLGGAGREEVGADTRHALLRERVPKVVRVAVLLNPVNATMSGVIAPRASSRDGET